MSNTSLYASELPDTLTEAQARQFFSKFGQVNNIILYQRKTTKSAKITFKSHEEAKAALNHLTSQKNANKINNKPFNINWHIDRQNNKEMCISLRGVPATVSPQNIAAVLEPYGTVTVSKAKVQFSFNVYFQTREACEQALRNAQMWSHQIGPKVVVIPPVTLLQLPPHLLFMPVQNRQKSQKQEGNQQEQEQQQQPQQHEEPPSGPTIFDVVETNSGFLIFYNTPNDALNAYEASNGKLTNKVPIEILTIASKEIESRTVFVTGVAGLQTSEIKSFFQQAGDIADISIQRKSAIIQFKKNESQQKALKLSRQVIGNPPRFIIVVPFFDKTIQQQQQCGLLQLNELPPSLSVDDLIQEMSQYGNVVSATICPFSFPVNPTGLVMFSRFKDAVLAKEKVSSKYKNIFSFPSLNPFEIVQFFSDASNSCCVAIYDVNDKDSIESMINKFGITISKYMLDKTYFAYFTSDASALIFFQTLKQMNRKVELLCANGLQYANSHLRNIPLAYEWMNLLFFIHGLPQDIGNSQLRTILVDNLHVDIDSCFIGITPATGESNQTAVVLCKNPQNALNISKLSSFLNTNLTINYFQSRYGYTTSAVVPKYRFPDQLGKRFTTPREWIKAFVELNFKDIEDKLIPIIEQLSVFDTHQLTSNYPNFISWIENVISKL